MQFICEFFSNCHKSPQVFPICFLKKKLSGPACTVQSCVIEGLAIVEWVMGWCSKTKEHFKQY